MKRLTTYGFLALAAGVATVGFARTAAAAVEPESHEEAQVEYQVVVMAVGVAVPQA